MEIAAAERVSLATAAAAKLAEQQYRCTQCKDWVANARWGKCHGHCDSSDALVASCSCTGRQKSDRHDKFASCLACLQSIGDEFVVANSVET